MRKIVTALLALLLLTGCGSATVANNNNYTSETTTTIYDTTAQTTKPPTTTTQPTTITEAFNTALVLGMWVPWPGLPAPELPDDHFIVVHEMTFPHIARYNVELISAQRSGNRTVLNVSFAQEGGGLTALMNGAIFVALCNTLYGHEIIINPTQIRG